MGTYIFSPWDCHNTGTSPCWVKTEDDNSHFPPTSGMFHALTILSSLNSASEIDNGAAQCYLKCRGWNGSERFTLLPRTKYRKKTTLANLFSYMCRAQRSRNQWLYPGKENKPPEADSEWTCSSKTKPRTVFCACNSCWLPWEPPQRNCVTGRSFTIVTGRWWLLENFPINFIKWCVIQLIPALCLASSQLSSCPYCCLSSVTYKKTVRNLLWWTMLMPFLTKKPALNPG